MAPSELAGPGQSGADPDGVSDRVFRSLDIVARALHVKNAELGPALQAIVTTAAGTLSPAQHAGLITLSRGELVPQATTGPLPSSWTSCSKNSKTARASVPRCSRPLSASTT